MCSNWLAGLVLPISSNFVATKFWYALNQKEETKKAFDEECLNLFVVCF
jgi:hypothetical protein